MFAKNKNTNIRLFRFLYIIFLIPIKKYALLIDLSEEYIGKSIG